MLLAACGNDAGLKVSIPPADDPSYAASLPCVAVPGQEEWEYLGTALRAGNEGAFDRLLRGGFGGSALRVGDEILMYYQGARGYSEFQQSAAHRSIGVAVSGDGISFTKYPGNPVLAWSPNAGEEEGAVSVAPAIGPQGEIVAFYGANTMIAPTLVNADGRWAVSEDGRAFTDRGIALDHADPAVEGWGDELFPVIAFFHGGHWYVYYLPNGNGRPRGELAVAVGPRPDQMHETAAVQAGDRQIRAWGMQSAVHLCEDTFALFLNGESRNTMTVRLVDARTPAEASQPVAVYGFDPDGQTQGFSHGAILLDRQTGYWYLYHKDEDSTLVAVRRARIRGQ